MKIQDNKEVGCLSFMLIIVGIILLIPILIILGVVLVIYFLLSDSYREKKRKKELNKAIDENNGKLFFIYNEHNVLAFQSYFDKKNINIECIQEGYYNDKNVFLEYISDVYVAMKCPKLIKIRDGEVIMKEHFNSFKHHVKRNNDPESFFSLLKKSIIKLEKDESRIKT